MRVIFITCLLVWSTIPAMAADIEGRIKGAKFDWLSAQPYSDSYASSVWDLPLHLPAAERVVPGGATQIGTHIIFKNIKGDTVSLPLTIKGVSYRLSSHSATAGYKHGDNAAYSVSTGQGVDVIGDGVGDLIFTLSKTQTPFTHHRPLFDMNSETWTEGMKGKPPGTYRGVLNYTIKYRYYRNGIIIRNTLQASLVVTLKYEPLLLISVTAQGDGVISPVYVGFPERKVRGNTMYTIEARGVVPNGVQMKLQPVKGTGQYQLDSLSSADNSFITYSVKCTTGCSREDIIDDGNPNYESFIMAEDNGKYVNITHIARLSVGLKETALSELSSDIYRGSFTLIFQAAL